MCDKKEIGKLSLEQTAKKCKKTNIPLDFGKGFTVM